MRHSSLIFSYFRSMKKLTSHPKPKPTPGWDAKPNNMNMVLVYTLYPTWMGAVFFLHIPSTFSEMRMDFEFSYEV